MSGRVGAPHTARGLRPVAAALGLATLMGCGPGTTDESSAARAAPTSSSSTSTVAPSDTGRISAAACAAPTGSLSVSTAAPGDTVTIKGIDFTATCNDTGPDPEQSAPARGVPLTFRQGNAMVTLAKVDASEDYAIVVDVVIPQAASEGPAQLHLGSSAPLPLLIGS